MFGVERAACSSQDATWLQQRQQHLDTGGWGEAARWPERLQCVRDRKFDHRRRLTATAAMRLDARLADEAGGASALGALPAGGDRSLLTATVRQRRRPRKQKSQQALTC